MRDMMHDGHSITVSGHGCFLVVCSSQEACSPSSFLQKLHQPCQQQQTSTITYKQPLNTSKFTSRQLCVGASFQIHCCSDCCRVGNNILTISSTSRGRIADTSSGFYPSTGGTIVSGSRRSLYKNTLHGHAQRCSHHRKSTVPRGTHLSLPGW